jgi:hypothetical protein
MSASGTQLFKLQISLNTELAGLKDELRFFGGVSGTLPVFCLKKFFCPYLSLYNSFQ